MSEMSELMDFISGVTAVGSNMATAQLQIAEADAARLHKEKMLQIKADREGEQQMLTTNKALLKEEQTNQAAEIQSLISDGEAYGLTMHEYVNETNDKFKTDAFVDLFNMYDIQIGKDLSVSTKLFDTQSQTIDALNAKTKVNQVLINELTDMTHHLEDAEDLKRLLGADSTNQAIKGVLDIADVISLQKDIEKGRFDKEGQVDPKAEFAPYRSIYGEDITSYQEGYGDEATEATVLKTFFKDKPYLTEAMLHPNYWSEDTYNIIKEQVAQETDFVKLEEEKVKAVNSGALSFDDVVDNYATQLVQNNNKYQEIETAFRDGLMGDDEGEAFKNYMAYIKPIGDYSDTKGEIDTEASAFEFKKAAEKKIIRSFVHFIKQKQHKKSEGMNKISAWLVHGMENLENDEIRSSTVSRLYNTFMPRKIAIMDDITGQPTGEFKMIDESRAGFRHSVDEEGEPLIPVGGLKISPGHTVYDPATDSWKGYSPIWVDHVTDMGDMFPDVGGNELKYLNSMMNDWYNVDSFWGHLDNIHGNEVDGYGFYDNPGGHIQYNQKGSPGGVNRYEGAWIGPDLESLDNEERYTIGRDGERIISEKGYTERGWAQSDIKNWEFRGGTIWGATKQSILDAMLPEDYFPTKD